MHPQKAWEPPWYQQYSVEPLVVPVISAHTPPMAVAASAQQAFCDCDKYALFDASGQVIASNYQVKDDCWQFAEPRQGMVHI